MPGRAGVLRIEPSVASRPDRAFVADACALRLLGHSQIIRDGGIGTDMTCHYLIRSRLSSLANPMAYSSELVKSA